MDLNEPYASKPHFNLLWHTAEQYELEHIRHETWKRQYFLILSILDVRVPEDYLPTPAQDAQFPCPVCPARLNATGSRALRVAKYCPRPNSINDCVE